MNTIRNKAFWTLDSIKNEFVRKAFYEIDKYYNMDSNSSEMHNYHEKTLNKLISHAVKTTKFYSGYKNAHELYDLPVVDKNVIRSKQDSFLSSMFSKKNLIQMSTSGSTGTPFTSFQNKEKKKRVNAETIFFNGKAGYKVGNNFIYLRSLNIKNKKSKLKQWIQNEKLIDVNNLDDQEIQSLLSQIKDYSKKESATMLSYASTYDALADYFQRKGIESIKDCKIHGIISTSEILYNSTRKQMMKVFGCDCLSRYANMENGILGQDTVLFPNSFILNEANYYIEILEFDSNEPVKDGELGRIVVTDLYNYAMPMIRYDTGDVGTFKLMNINGNNKKVISNFNGRKIDMIFDVNGNHISPHKISVAFWDIPGLKQFQFIQENAGKYRVLLIVDNYFGDTDLKNKLHRILGKEAIINFNKVQEIPTLNSGKRKYIINKTL
ncbi:phenylacetate-CoA ligase [Cerasibacillus quisquiliarum]|uniref:phenylacetate--CoA ligase family protein n=1 Tax=Cerasibacillus quisquiliarum TaxID=227865 RepID=UPI0011BDFC55|nr:phenylacetate--CoA ligase family protein [Cerasibacillus quisquiliarum]MBB5144964.1 phenylacetate-CoA ligase [Cerasibacillus quisquiliarum]